MRGRIWGCTVLLDHIVLHQARSFVFGAIGSKSLMRSLTTLVFLWNSQRYYPIQFAGHTLIKCVSVYFCRLGRHDVGINGWNWGSVLRAFILEWTNWLELKRNGRNWNKLRWEWWKFTCFGKFELESKCEIQVPITFILICTIEYLAVFACFTNCLMSNGNGLWCLNLDETNFLK